jgi:uncharacterized protein
MAERSSYAPGTFCWAELSASDPEAAKRFYGSLLGWQYRDTPLGDGAVYSIAEVDGMAVAAIAPQPQQQAAAGLPPVWSSYVSVQSADASAQHAKDLGGNVHAPPFDVMSAGRMAVIQDPQGAYFMLWQAHEMVGAQLVNAPGALVWNELASSDLDDSSSFYSRLFGWEIAQFEGSSEPYLSIRNAGANNGGIRPLTPAGGTPHWLVYFGVQNTEEALSKLGAIGGSTLAGPIDIEMAKIAVVQDPQGAVFAIYAGTFEP